MVGVHEHEPAMHPGGAEHARLEHGSSTFAIAQGLVHAAAVHAERDAHRARCEVRDAQAQEPPRDQRVLDRQSLGK